MQARVTTFCAAAGWQVRVNRWQSRKYLLVCVSGLDSTSAERSVSAHAVAQRGWDAGMKWNEGFSALNGLTMPHSRQTFIEAQRPNKVPVAEALGSVPWHSERRGPPFQQSRLCHGLTWSWRAVGRDGTQHPGAKATPFRDTGGHKKHRGHRDTCQIYNVMLMFCSYLSYLLYLSSYQSGKILHEQAAFGCATAVMSALALAAQCCDHLQLPVLATRPETRSFPLEVWRWLGSLMLELWN